MTCTVGGHRDRRFDRGVAGSDVGKVDRYRPHPDVQAGDPGSR